jgi:hypothetical protein
LKSIGLSKIGVCPFFSSTFFSSTLGIDFPMLCRLKVVFGLAFSFGTDGGIDAIGT